MYHALNIIEDAIDASKNIPETMTADEAASELLGYLYDMPERERDPDAWFMRRPRKWQ